MRGSIAMPPPSSSAALLPLLLLLLSASLPPTAAAKGRYASTTATSSYRHISWASNLTLLGAASLLPGAAAVALTTNSSNGIGAGRALFSAPVRFLLPPPDPSTAPAQAFFPVPYSFLTRFTFSIAPSPSYGDGLAFILTSSRTFLGGSNGFLGLYPSAPASDDGEVAGVTTIAVEMDTHLDVALRDRDDNHIALDTGSIYSVVSSSPGVDLKGGQPITAWVEYRATRRRLRAWLSYSSSRRPNKPALSVSVDLSPFLQAQMYVGFSASNGEGTAVHVVNIEDWELRVSAPQKTSSQSTSPPTSTDLAASPPSPALQDDAASSTLDSPLPLKELPKGQHQYLALAVKIIGGVLGCFVVFGTLLWLLWIVRHRSKAYKIKMKEQALRRILPPEVGRSV